LRLRLYVAGHSPNSAAALGNLAALGEGRLRGAYELEVVDVLEAPEVALADGILVTPTLVKLAPLPACRIVGNLSDVDSVMLALGMGR
jgi:circadian clock protein KaiB